MFMVMIEIFCLLCLCFRDLDDYWEQLLVWRQQLPALVQNVIEFKFTPESPVSTTQNME